MKEQRRDRIASTASVVVPEVVVPATPAAPAVRLFTARDWARGRNDSLTRAFLAVLSQDRVEKKPTAEWTEIYRNWLTQPRG